jgi:hypothetical protein
VDAERQRRDRGAMQEYRLKRHLRYRGSWLEAIPYSATTGLGNRQGIDRRAAPIIAILAPRQGEIGAFDVDRKLASSAAAQPPSETSEAKYFMFLRFE